MGEKARPGRLRLRYTLLLANAVPRSQRRSGDSFAITRIGNPWSGFDHLEIGHLDGLQIARAEQAAPLVLREAVTLCGQRDVASVGQQDTVTLHGPGHDSGGLVGKRVQWIVRP